LSKPTLSVDGSSQLCRWSSHHCRLVARFNNTAGLYVKPTMMARPTLSSRGSALFTITTGFVLAGSDLFFRILLFYIFFIFFVESGFALYLDDRSINIKHYKCYGYSSNVLIKILIPQNRKEITIV
jgi:hypothetical protein